MWGTRARPPDPRCPRGPASGQGQRRQGPSGYPRNPGNQVGAGSYRLERMRRSLAPLKPKPAPALGMVV